MRPNNTMNEEKTKSNEMQAFYSTYVVSIELLFLNDWSHTYRTGCRQYVLVSSVDLLFWSNLF